MRRLTLSKIIALFVYYVIAKHIPTIQGVPDVGGKLRKYLCRVIFPVCGRGLHIEVDVDFGQGQRLEIGDNVTIKRGTQLNLNSTVRIGNNTYVGEETIVYTQDHGHARKDIPMQQQPYLKKPVFIGNFVTIGPRCIIVKGAVIDDNAIIYPGAVVAGHIKANTRVAGIPAKKTCG